MTDQPLAPPASASPATTKNDPPPPLVIEAEQLFQGRREIAIEHEGNRYRLRITRRNKLILQK
jgi:hemin uptake protein HemP